MFLWDYETNVGKYFFTYNLLKTFLTHLNAGLKNVSRKWETFLPVNRLAEDYQLLKKEDPSFLCSGEEAAVLLGDSEGVLL